MPAAVSPEVAELRGGTVLLVGRVGLGEYFPGHVHGENIRALQMVRD